MSFGFSPSDVIKLLEISTRVYIAFKDANDNSEAQVEGLIREFKAFAQCLIDLDELMKEFGKPLPFPVEDFKKTLQKCEAGLKPYEENLVDKKMGITKIVWTIKYIGKEKELDGLRKQITGHYQALHMCLSFLQLRLNLEQTKRSQRLLVEPRHRAMSLGGQWYTSEALGSSSHNAPKALPSTEEAHPLYKDWEIFNRWLKTEDERIAVEAGLSRPLSLGDTPAAAPTGDAETAAILYHLRREVDDAIMIEENRSKRTAAEKRSHLAPSDAMKQKVRSMPPAPNRTYTLETDHSGNFSGFDPPTTMGGTSPTIRPGPSSPSPRTSLTGSPQIEHSFFGSDWAHSPTSPTMSPTMSADFARTSSVSTNRSSLSNSPDSRRVSSGLGISTAGTTPENAMSRTIRPKLSVTSLATIALGEGALDWNSLCRKVQVERVSSDKSHGRERTNIESKECDIHWRYREDAGISLRSLYRSSKDGKPKVWAVQNFPATGPSIPLTTTFGDGEVSIDFPRGSFGKLDKNWSDIKYTFAGTEQSTKFQTLLYTNNGRDDAELLFDRPILTISSTKTHPECRGRNLRLWRRSETHLTQNGPVTADVLVLLFYTSALGDKGHWVEEPHYAFEWLPSATYKKDCEKLTLVFSKEPAKWTSDKLFQRRKSSRSDDAAPTSPIWAMSKRKDSMEIPGITRSGTETSVASASSALSIRSSLSVFGRSKESSRMANLNQFGYSKLEIEFLGKKDRRAFLEVWGRYVKPLSGLS
ncbi:hypothetical protein IQ07DRAFT_562218 [Pyrenochaeta sp. DS3sAY3a]|nr:hypothetical protein IQ07DRAFT_562218 [Pyrenochaeta sp. DS3sAY3a]